MSTMFGTKAVSDITGVSRQAIRAYTTKYARHLSAGATPEQGIERQFTSADLKVIAFIYTLTQSGMTHDQVQRRLSSGALDSFEWKMPHMAPETPQDSQPATEPAFVHMAHLEATHRLLDDTRVREQQVTEQFRIAQERLQVAQENLAQLRYELGRTEGVLSVVRTQRRKPPKWWVSLFGEPG